MVVAVLQDGISIFFLYSSILVESSDCITSCVLGLHSFIHSFLQTSFLVQLRALYFGAALVFKFLLQWRFACWSNICHFWHNQTISVLPTDDMCLDSGKLPKRLHYINFLVLFKSGPVYIRGAKQICLKFRF